MSHIPKHIVLTGPPGIGKTTLVRKCCERLRDNSITVQGFYTQELRERGKRTGFDVVTVTGERAPLARVENKGDLPGSREPMVGQYAVKVKSFETLAIPSLSKKTGSGSDEQRIVVIDEIGKMEMFSQSFIRTVRTIMQEDHTTVLATIPIARGKPIPLVEEVRHHKQAAIFEISRENRDAVIEEIYKTLMDALMRDKR